MNMMQSGTRVGIALVFAMAMLALAGQTNAEPCTPETCPPGPVAAYFQYSNCTGEVTYEPISPPFPMNECLNDSTSSYIVEITEQYFEYRSHGGVTDCGKSGDTGFVEGFREYFGSCTPDINDKKRGDRYGKMTNPLGFAGLGSRLSRSAASDLQVTAMAYLIHVNATMERQDPIPVDVEVPVLSEIRVDEECYSPDNCTFNGEPPQFYFTDYTNDTCMEAEVSYMYANFTAGSCYRRRDLAYSYIRTRCVDAHTVVDEVVAGDCERILYAEFYHPECRLDSGTSVLQCLAAPAPFTPAATIPVVPISSSPSHSASSIMIAFLFATIAFIASF